MKKNRVVHSWGVGDTRRVEVVSLGTDLGGDTGIAFVGNLVVVSNLVFVRLMVVGTRMFSLDSYPYFCKRLCQSVVNA